MRDRLSTGAPGPSDSTIRKWVMKLLSLEQGLPFPEGRRK